VELLDNSRAGDNTGVIQLKPVGIVKNQSRQANWEGGFNARDWRATAATMKAQSETVSEIIINSELEDSLDGIDDFSHLTVLYWAHLIPEKNRLVKKVHPLGSQDFPLVGVFATHSPARPNSILITVVKLLGRQGNILRVTGLDALDGSPVLDIKPFYAENIKSEEIRIPSWMQRMHDKFK